MHLNPIAIIQARFNSTRLPGKVLKKIGDKRMLEFIYDRLIKSKKLKKVVVATSNNKGDEKIRDFCKLKNIECFTGSEEDVLDRFYQTAKALKADPVIRITGDCPFVDPYIVDTLIDTYFKNSFDHVGVATGAGSIFFEENRFPDGLDAECFKFDALFNAWKNATSKTEREHVTPYIWKNSKLFKLGSIFSSIKNIGHLRFTVDVKEDLEFIRALNNKSINLDQEIYLEELIEILKNNPDLLEINNKINFNNEYLKIWDEINDK